MSNLTNAMNNLTNRMHQVAMRLFEKGMKKEPGIDGILVTVGLCIIALLLCVVMRTSLEEFITTIVGEMTTKAHQILTGVTT